MWSTMLNSIRAFSLSSNAPMLSFYYDKTNVLTLIAIFFLAWWCTDFWRTQRKYREYLEKIPGPYSLPFIGNIQHLRFSSDELYRSLIEMRKLFGAKEGINKVWIGPKPYIFVSKASTVEPILRTNLHNDKSHFYRFLEPWLGSGLLTSTGDKWFARRKLLTPAFHFKILEDFVDIFGEQTSILVDKLSREVGTDRFNIFPYVTLCTLDIICETAMGRQVFAQDDSDSVYVRAVYEISNIVATRHSRIWYHPDSLFRLSSLYSKQRKCIRVLHDFSNKVISERRSNIDRVEVNGNARKRTSRRLAFLDLLLELSKEGAVLSNDDIREEVDTFMFEGHDTTSTAVCWTLFLLGCNLDVQDRVVCELEEIFGDDSDRRPTLKDLKSMTYLEMCIKETLRLYPSVPMISRRALDDVQIGKYVVPEGTTMIVLFPVLHRDADVFPNPEDFDPDRFLPSNCASRHPYAYIPFSAGPRNCIGQKFAMLEEKVIISGILRKYRVEAMQRREDVSIAAELIIRAKDGLHIKISPRSRIHKHCEAQ